MSRVEKYREYRNEIASLPDEPKQTKKRQSSQRVEKILKQNKEQNKLAFEDVYEGLDIYNVSSNNESKHLSYKKKMLIIFYAVMSVLIVGLIIALIFIGQSAFGGK